MCGYEGPLMEVRGDRITAHYDASGRGRNLR
jgi:hypothetical protein